MSVPSKRRTSSSKGRRQSHDALKPAKLISCPKCKKAMRPHQACPSCGSYKGREVVTLKSKANKKSASA